MNNKPEHLPTEMPAIGGWFWNEKTQHREFLMPPYPGVDDCVKINGSWAYRSLVERDERRIAAKQSEQNNVDLLSSSLL